MHSFPSCKFCQNSCIFLQLGKRQLIPMIAMSVSDTIASCILPVPFRVSWACHRSTVTKSSQPFPLARYFAPLGALRLLYIMRGRRLNLLFNPLGEKLCQCVNSWILKKHFND